MFFKIIIMQHYIVYTHKEFDALPKWLQHHLISEWKMKVLKNYTIFI
jgi:hypothetical protein